MDIKKLKYFVEIVNQGSISRAASRLSVAQSALSFHINNLEKEFGKTLLIRGAKGVLPTEAGLFLMERAETLLHDFEKLKQDTLDFGQKPKGTVRIGLPGTISNVLSEPLIAKCKEEYPEIKLVIAEAMSGFVRDWVSAGDVDLAILYMDVQNTNISSTLLLEEEIVLVHSPKTLVPTPFASQNLCNIPLILPSSNHGLRLMLEGAMKSQGSTLNPTIEIDSFHNIKKLVEKGYGYSLLPYHAVSTEISENRLNVTHLSDRHFWRRIYLAQSGSRLVTTASTTVASLIKNQISSLVNAKVWAGAKLL